MRESKGNEVRKDRVVLWKKMERAAGKRFDGDISVCSPNTQGWEGDVADASHEQVQTNEPPCAV